MSAAFSLRVDRIRCDGHGFCAAALPERIRPDEWGYPIVDAAAIGPGLVDHARRAVDTCPLLALRLDKVAPGL